MFVARNDLIYNNVARLSYGIAVVDIDGDGQFEFVVTGFGYANLALKWNGRGLLDAADAILADAQCQAIAVAAGDMDGDGVEEIYVINSETFTGSKHHHDRLFALHEGQRINLFAQPEYLALANQSAGRSVVAIDRFGYGRYAFFVANYGAPMRLYELTTNGHITDSARAAHVHYATGGRGVAAAPLFGQDVDIIAVNERGPNLILKNNGDGTFVDVAATYQMLDRQHHGRGIALFDALDHGRFAICYGNWEGPHRLWVWDDDAQTYVDIAPEAMQTPSRVRTVIAADFDNDGNPELFFNNMGEPNRLFGRRNGTWIELDIGDARETDGLGTGAAVADIDGDGRLELIIAHGETAPQPLGFYRVAPNHNHWFRVRPLTRRGAPARGATVTLEYADRTVIQVIDGGSGYQCQMEPVAHFGLGEHTIIDRVTICWPGGTTAIVTNPGVDQLLIMPHPTGDDDPMI